MAAKLKVQFECPHCDKRVLAEFGKQGKGVACPGCSKKIIVPASEHGLDMIPFALPMERETYPAPVPLHEAEPWYETPEQYPVVVPVEPVKKQDLAKPNALSQANVPFEVTFPGVASVKTQISRKTAGTCAKFSVLGVVLAILMIILGVKPGRK